MLHIFLKKTQLYGFKESNLKMLILSHFDDVGTREFTFIQTREYETSSVIKFDELILLTHFDYGNI